MNLKKVDPRRFTEIVSNAKGRIIFTTEEGDRLVSGSLLSTLVGLASLIQLSDQVKIDIACDEAEDEAKLEALFAETIVE